MYFQEKNIYNCRLTTVPTDGTSTPLPCAGIRLGRLCSWLGSRWGETAECGEGRGTPKAGNSGLREAARSHFAWGRGGRSIWRGLCFSAASPEITCHLHVPPLGGNKRDDPVGERSHACSFLCTGDSKRMFLTGREMHPSAEALSRHSDSTAGVSSKCHTRGKVLSPQGKLLC